MKSKCPSWRGKATVRPRCQGRRSVAFIGAQRRPLTEEGDGSGAGLARKGSAFRISKTVCCVFQKASQRSPTCFIAGDWCVCIEVRQDERRRPYIPTAQALTRR